MTPEADATPPLATPEDGPPFPTDATATDGAQPSRARRRQRRTTAAAEGSSPPGAEGTGALAAASESPALTAESEPTAPARHTGTASRSRASRRPAATTPADSAPSPLPESAPTAEALPLRSRRSRTRAPAALVTPAAETVAGTTEAGADTPPYPAHDATAAAAAARKEPTHAITAEVASAATTEHEAEREAASTVEPIAIAAAGSAPGGAEQAPGAAAPVAPERIALADLSLSELEALVVEMGQPPFRARQVFTWLYRDLTFDIEQMRTLPKPFRAALAARAITLPPDAHR